MRSSVFIFTASLVASSMAAVHETTTKNATDTVTEIYDDEKPWSMCMIRCTGEMMKLGGEDKTGCKYTKSKFAPDDQSCTCTDEKWVRALSSCLTRQCAEDAPGAENLLGLSQLFVCQNDFNATLNMDAWGAGIEEAEKEGLEVDQKGWSEEKKERRKAAEELIQKKVAKATESSKETAEEKAEETNVEKTKDEEKDTAEEKAEETNVEETNDEEKEDDDKENAAGKSVVGMGVTTGAASMILLLAAALL